MRSLEAGEWAPGAAIPSELELAERFNVSQGTVRKAIDEMASENMLVRRQGKGTFVSTHNDPRSFYRFLRLMPDEGAPMQSKSLPIACANIAADEAMAKVLHIAIGDPVVHVRRLLSFDGTPVVLDDLYLVGELFRGMTLEALIARERSLYSTFEEVYGVRMLRAEERLRAIAADAEASKLLGVPEGSPLLQVERVAFTYGDRPVEWRRGRYHTSRHHYLNSLG